MNQSISNISAVVSTDERALLKKESYHYPLFLTTVILCGLGLIAIYAASALKGQQQFGDAFIFFKKQAIITVFGFFLIFIAHKLPKNFFRRLPLPVMGGTIFLLLLIFVPGIYFSAGGAQRWISLPLIGSAQPAELTKIALVLFLARNLSRNSADISSFSRGVLPNLSVFLLLSCLLLVQKDLGTPFLLFCITVTMLFIAGIGSRIIMIFFLAGVILAGIAIAIEPYRLVRITSFLDPWSHVQGSGFQIIQSFLAFQNGGFLGAGLGESKQKLFFLPEAHTDFILAVIGEELGLLGSLLLVLLFSFYCFLGFRIAYQQKESYHQFLAVGFTVMITVQALINIGVVMGLLPTKGIPLPFISSGNSSLLVSLFATAVLLRLAKQDHSELDGQNPI